MKRNFNISIKRSRNYQSVEVSGGFEEEFLKDKDFEEAKQKTIQQVKEEVEKQLSYLNNPEPTSTKSEPTKKKPITLEV